MENEQEFKNVRREIYATSEFAFVSGMNKTLHGERTFIPAGGDPKNPVTLKDITVELCYPVDCGENPEITITITNLSGLTIKVVQEQEVIPLAQERESEQEPNVISLTA